MSVADRRDRIAAGGIVGLMLAALAGEAPAQMLDCPAFPEPKAKLEWVAPHMIYNGVPMSIKRFDSEQSPGAILAFYRAVWKSPTPALSAQEYQSGPWQTIAAVRGKCFFTVQVQSDGKRGSTGLLSATQEPDGVKVESADHVLPMMTGSEVINDIEHKDGGKNARTLLLRNGFSPEANADFYRRNMGDKGWKMVSGYEMATKKGPGITLVMKRGMAETSLVITREGGKSMVLANMVDEP